MTAVSEISFRAEGYAFVYDRGRSEFTRCGARRTRIVSLVGDGAIITVLPARVEPDEIRCDFGTSGRLVITDGRDFELDVIEQSSL